MTKDYGFGAVSAVVYEKDAEGRSTVRDALRELGFAEIAFAASGEELEQLLRVDTPDLLFCGYNHRDEDICVLLRSLRAGAIGTNPFLIIVAASSDADEETATAFRNAGVDGFLNSPVSADLLSKFLAAQVRARKKFVATTDYIGPDRRRDTSRSGAECFDVFNPLKGKPGGPEEADIGERIDQDLRASLVRLNAERQRRNIMQLCVLWRQLEQRRAGTRDFAATLSKMSVICGDIEGRIGDGHPRTAHDHCRTALDAIQGMEAALQSGLGGEGGRPQLCALLDRLGEAAIALANIHVSGALAPSKLFELDELIAAIGTRGCTAEISAVNLAVRRTGPFIRPY